MMKKIELIEDISKELNIIDIQNEIYLIKKRLEEKNSSIVIPIVGEFSSGKTTLINAISEGKKLETSSRPTTSVIYEIYFNNEIEKAEIIDKNDNIIEVLDISSIENDKLNETKFIRIFDTNKNINENIILVDTPGLSSNDENHLDALTNYLPNADALILCIDANQQITNTLLDFIKFNNLAHLPLFLAITKTDTKTIEEIVEIKNYISKNINIKTEQIISISAINNDLDEFYSLIENIQDNKNKIIENVLNYKVEKTAEYLNNYLVNLINSSKEDKSLDEELKTKKSQLDKLKRAIEKLITDSQEEIEDIINKSVQEFRKIIQEKLDTIISERNENADKLAYSSVNNTAKIIFENYQNEIRKKIFLLAKDRKNTDLGIPLNSLQSIDMSDIQMNQLSYNINLASAGQDSIKNWSTGIKIIGSIAAVAITAGAASTLIGGAAVAGETAIGIGAATNIIDTVTDVANISSNRKTRNVLENMKNHENHINNFHDRMQTVEQYNSQVGQIIAPHQNKGFIENIVGNIGDSVLGKPQRKKMINDYLENTLLHEFQSNLSSISYHIVNNLQIELNQEAEEMINELINKLTELSKLANEENEKFLEKIKLYKSFINLLNSL